MAMLKNQMVHVLFVWYHHLESWERFQTSFVNCTLSDLVSLEVLAGGSVDWRELHCKYRRETWRIMGEWKMSPPYGSEIYFLPKRLDLNLNVRILSIIKSKSHQVTNCLGKSQFVHPHYLAKFKSGTLYGAQDVLKWSTYNYNHLGLRKNWGAIQQMTSLFGVFYQPVVLNLQGNDQFGTQFGKRPSG